MVLSFSETLGKEFIWRGTYRSIMVCSIIVIVVIILLIILAATSAYASASCTTAPAPLGHTLLAPCPTCHGRQFTGVIVHRHTSANNNYTPEIFTRKCVMIWSLQRHSLLTLPASTAPHFLINTHTNHLLWIHFILPASTQLHHDTSFTEPSTFNQHSQFYNYFSPQIHQCLQCPYAGLMSFLSKY